MSRVVYGAVWLILLLSVPSPPLKTSRAIPVRAPMGRINLPLHFEPTADAPGEPSAFIARGPGHSCLLTPEWIEIGCSRNKIRLRFQGAVGTARLNGAGLLPGRTNYFIGPNPSAWRAGIASFARVNAAGVYPGIDVQYRGSGSELEFDLLVAPGANLGGVRLAFDGADHAEVDRGGQLRLHNGDSEVILRKPRAFQQAGPAGREVPIQYAMESANCVRFITGAYDPSLALTVDPVISYSTHLGGGGETGRAIFADDFGNVYVAGETPSLQFSTKNPVQPASGGLSDAFVTKISADGSELVYSTYLGGSGDDRAMAIAVDPWGNAYITGSTRSSDFPVRNAAQPRLSGGNSSDAFIAKLNSSGSTLLYSTYLGGGDDDTGNGIVVDAAGAACIVGTTLSNNFPLRQPLQWASGGLEDAVVARLSPDGSRLLFSTYFGGSNSDYGRSIALDGSGNACITGATASANFPLRNALQRAIAGVSSPFVVRFNLSSPGLIFSTYLGSGEGNAIAADRSGSSYITGQTGSMTFPTLYPMQPHYGGGSQDAFITKIDSSGASIVYSTFLGGQNTDVGYGIALNPAGEVYVAGSTSSYNFPMKNPLHGTLRGGEDAFVAHLNASGSALLFATFWGGTGNDRGLGLSVDTAGNICLTGSTYSSDFPTRAALRPYLNGFLDAFIVKLAPDTPLRQYLYFPQIAAGGGSSTVFYLTNTGSTTAEGTLGLIDKSGKALNVLWNAAGAKSLGPSRGLSVAAGASLVLTADPIDAAGAQQTGSALLDTAGGRLTGAATYRLSDGQTLKSVAGIPASQPTEYATIPVDNDDSQLRYTGFAVANPENAPVSVKLVTLDEKGKLVDSFYPGEMNPLAAGAQTARFLHELLPSRARFKGSLSLQAQGGGRIVVVALVQNHGLFTAIPVILAKPSGI